MIEYIYTVVVIVSFYIIAKMLFKKAKDIQNQVVLITGGANGLGKEIALQLSKLGCKIAIADLDIMNAEKTIQEILSEGGCKDAKAYKVNRFLFYYYYRIVTMETALIISLILSTIKYNVNFVIN